MNKSSVLFLILLTFGIFNATAQAIMVIKKDKVDRIAMHPGAIKDSVVIDESQLSVKYRFSNNGKKIGVPESWCYLSMQIGENVVKQTDLCLYYDNLMYTKQQSNGSLSSLRDSVADYPSNLFVELISDRKMQTITVVCGDFFRSDALKKYSQSTPIIQWKLLDEHQMINGYDCRKATGLFGGRIWTVWYAIDIPIASGPWKLNGLPGLILMASDNDFCFECVSLVKNNKSIIQYVYRNMQDLKTLQNYLKYERNCYEHPYQIFANGQQATVILGKSDGSMTYLDETWTIPYNPIELE